jgi:hypothetical protein
MADGDAVSHETCRAALDKLTLRPAPETPEKPASAQITLRIPSSRFSAAESGGTGRTDDLFAMRLAGFFDVAVGLLGCIAAVAARWPISMSARPNSTSGIGLGSSPPRLATDAVGTA